VGILTIYHDPSLGSHTLAFKPFFFFMNFNVMKLCQKALIAEKKLYKPKNVIIYDIIIFFYGKMEDEIHFDSLIKRNDIVQMRLVCLDFTIYLLFGILKFF
jgi:hypothetical protein